MAEPPTVAASATSTSETTGPGSWIAFLVGGLLVAVAIIAWLMLTGGQVEPPPVQIPDSVDVNVPAPDLSAAPVPVAQTPAPAKD